MICMARSFGAPVIVPAGKVARTASSGLVPSPSRPLTVDTRWNTCENASTAISSSTGRVEGRLTLPMSFRQRSTSMMCSACSLALSRISLIRRWFSSSSGLRRAVPAMGHMTIVSSSIRMNSSGLAPISSFPAPGITYM